MSIKQGSNLIAGSGGGIANYDGKSITENAMEEIQTVGVINSRDSSTAVKTWTGTKAQYNALKVAHTMYQWGDSYAGIFLYTEALRPNDNDPVYDSSYNIISKVINLAELGEDIYIFIDNGEMYGRPIADESTTTIYENRIDPNTLYNITDTGEIYLGSTLLSNYGADTSLSNLTNTGKNIANWSNNVTNCITEIPQDIKLELNNGTLKLKAESKGYMGNGTVRTITGEPTLKNTGSAQMFLHITSGGTDLYAGYMTGGTVSERPSSPITYATYYNTNTQKCEYYNGSTWNEISLPIAIVTRGADGFTSIDQVFNGFGYIGSTIFALPNVKGLIPNGRNADGTLKNIEFTTSTVTIRTETGGATKYIALGKNSRDFYGPYFEQVIQPSSSGLWYNPETNLIKRSTDNGNTWVVRKEAILGNYISSSNGTITSLTTKTAFHALDYNDSSTISGWSMPSNRYIDLTLGASGTQYVAPANGYIILAGELSANTWLNIRDDDILTNIYQTQQLTYAYSMGYMFAIKKGGKFSINWGGGSGWSGQEWQKFRFVYAEGEN